MGDKEKMPWRPQLIEREQFPFKKRILLIDDKEDFCLFVRRNLERTGKFVVTTTTNPVEGINIAKEKRSKPHLILLDILMPLLSGVEVAEMLRSDPKTKNIPIIFLTAVVSKEEMGNEAIKKWGGENFVAKPVTTEQLITAINRALREKERYGI